MSECKQCCVTCKYSSYDKIQGYVCVNDESEYVGDYVEKEFSCPIGTDRRKMNEGCVTEKRCFI